MRVALTGASSGIGAATARTLMRAGHEVVAFDLAEPVEGARWIACDLSDPAAIDAGLDEVGGSFDALVLNAGLPPLEGQAERVLNVNFLGLRRVLDGLMPRLSDGGSVVAVASKAGQFWRENVEEVRALMAIEGPEGLPGLIEARGIGHVRAYDLSKEAVIALAAARTEALAARGQRINTVSPAAVETAILSDFVSAFGERAERGIARMGRPGRPEEVAEVIAFLAGPGSAWMRGVDVPVDGGLAAMMQAEALGL